MNLHAMKILRLDRGWTQRDLALKSGVSEQTITLIETRRRRGSAETVSRLAAALGVSEEVLTSKGRLRVVLDPGIDEDAEAA